jgi:hypothetical protein
MPNMSAGYRVEVTSERDRKVIGAYVDDVMVAAAYAPDLPTGMWTIATPGLPALYGRDKDEAVEWVSFLAARRAA